MDGGPEDLVTWTAGAGFALAALYYLAAWLMVGRGPVLSARSASRTDPARPAWLSPAALRYLRRMSFDTRTAAAAVLGLAARGHVIVEYENGRFRLLKCDCTAPLPPGEAALAHALLYTRSAVTLHNSNEHLIAPALAALRRRLVREHGRVAFRTNRHWLTAGLILSALALAAATAAAPRPGEFLTLSGLAMVSVIGLTALMQALLPDRYIFPEPLSRGFRAAMRRAVKAGAILVATPLAMTGLVKMISAPATPVAAIAFMAGLAGLNVLFYHLMKAPTRTGRRLRDGIEAIRARLARGDAVPEAPLPTAIYAFALDADNVPSTEGLPEWARDHHTPRKLDSIAGLGDALARAFDGASMPPANDLFGGGTARNQVA